MCLSRALYTIVMESSDQWGSSSYISISNAEGDSVDISPSLSSVSSILYHPLFGVLDLTPITDCAGFTGLSPEATALVVGDNACNDASITSFTLETSPNLVYVEIGSTNFQDVATFSLNGFQYLEYVHVKQSSFTTVKDAAGSNYQRSFEIVNCPHLKEIDIEEYSFSDYAGGFVLSELPELKTVTIGRLRQKSFNFARSRLDIQCILWLSLS